MSTLEITIQRRLEDAWPVIAEHHRAGTLLPVRSEGRLKLDEPSSPVPHTYGRALGKGLFQESIRDAFVRARSEGPDATRVWVFVEAEELKTWRWQWLCAPMDGGRWDFLSLDQRASFSLYLPSLTERPYPPIGLHDLNALLVVANPADYPDKRYDLVSFDADQKVASLRAIFEQQRIPSEVLARTQEAVGAPTLDGLAGQLTAGSARGPYTILHLVCHGRFDPADGETSLYLEQPGSAHGSGEVLAKPVTGKDLIDRLHNVRLPYLVFLSVCESSAPEAEQRVGGLAQRLVRDLGIPAVIGMTERVTIATAHALAEAFYERLLAQGKAGWVDRALVEAYAGLADRPDVNVPALYSRLGAQPLFSAALDGTPTPDEIHRGLEELRRLLVERAPVLQSQLAKSIEKLVPSLDTDVAALSTMARHEHETALGEVNELCQEAVEISFNALAQGNQPPLYDARQPFRGLSPFRSEDQEFFFGRGVLIAKLLQKLAEDPFLAVLGPSGIGKSSLVLAGLVPCLKEQMAGLQVIEVLTPGSAPMEQLKVRRRRRRQVKLVPEPVLYVVDQFEELFTLCKDENQRREFIAELLRLVQKNRLVLSMGGLLGRVRALYGPQRTHAGPAGAGGADERG